MFFLSLHLQAEVATEVSLLSFSKVTCSITQGNVHWEVRNRDSFHSRRWLTRYTQISDLPSLCLYFPLPSRGKGIIFTYVSKHPELNKLKLGYYILYMYFQVSAFIFPKKTNRFTTMNGRKLPNSFRQLKFYSIEGCLQNLISGLWTIFEKKEAYRGAYYNGCDCSIH